MNQSTSLYLDQFLFATLPYVAMVTLIIVTIQRYRSQKFTYSSLSSQFLENKTHFWAMVPFHYGVIIVTAGHLVAFLFPRELLLWNAVPVRLYILEISALACGILTLVGMVMVIFRRVTDQNVALVTSPMDKLLYAFLMFQIFSGIYIAIFNGWGSSWFATNLSPYLWSLVKFRPDLSYVVSMPLAVKAHIVCAYIILLLFPFSRLVHILVIPNQFLWRQTQVVRWYYNRLSIRKNR